MCGLAISRATNKRFRSRFPPLINRLLKRPAKRCSLVAFWRFAGFCRCAQRVCIPYQRTMKEYIKRPTEVQIQLLCEMMHRAFVEMRLLGWSGKSQEVAALADAFHNLPVEMLRDDFNWTLLRHSLTTYQQKHQPSEHSHYNYLEVLDRIVKTE